MLEEEADSVVFKLVYTSRRKCWSNKTTSQSKVDGKL